MNGKDLFAAMSYVDEQYVEEAETVTIPKTANSTWRKWVSLAACLCVVALGAFALGHFQNPAQSESVADANNRFEGQQEVAQLPGSEEIQHGTPEGAAKQDTPDTANQVAESEHLPDFADEVPSVAIRIVAWQENGFRGTVAELVDTDIFAIGMDLTVIFDEETCILSWEGNQGFFDNRMPTQEDFPEGALVKVQFTSYERETGTIYASMISFPQTDGF